MKEWQKVLYDLYFCHSFFICLFSGKEQIFRHFKVTAVRSKNPNLAVMRLRPPDILTLLSQETSCQDTHDSTMTGDQDILILLFSQIPEKGLASFYHVRNGFYRLWLGQNFR